MEPRPKLLLVDDETELLDSLEPFLRRSGFQVVSALNGEDALRKVESFEPDLVVLDILMPGIDGFEVLRRLRRRDKQLYILMLTQVTGADNRIEALNAGADDYLDKPFAMGEVLARIRALLRRPRAAGPPDQKPHQLGCGNLFVDLDAYRVFAGKKELALGRKEIGVLACLMLHAGALVPIDVLVEAVWGPDAFITPSSLYACISRLRRVLEDEAQPCLIETVYKAGYRFIGQVEVLR
jgi:two-component system response regulator PrrA